MLRNVVIKYDVSLFFLQVFELYVGNHPADFLYFLSVGIQVNFYFLRICEHCGIYTRRA